jgi:anti-sigma B factor antagonist
MAFTITTRRIDEVTVVDLCGRMACGEPLDLFRNTVRRLVDEGCGRFVLNLSDVDSIDSSGLGELIKTRVTLARRGGNVNLVGVGKKVKDLLVMTKLLVVFDCFDDESDAIAALLAEEARASTAG